MYMYMYIYMYMYVYVYVHVHVYVCVFVSVYVYVYLYVYVYVYVYVNGLMRGRLLLGFGFTLLLGCRTIAAIFLRVLLVGTSALTHQRFDPTVL